MSKEQEKAIEGLEAKLAEASETILALKKELEIASKDTPKVKKKTKIIEGMMQTVLHSGVMIVRGTPKDKIPEDILEALSDKIGQVEVEA